MNHRLVIEACDHGIMPQCSPSPGIRIAVSNDAKLGSNDGSPRGGRGQSSESSTPDGDRFAYEGHFGGPFDPSGGPFNTNGGQQAMGSHRIEVIVACLVVVFGVLLFAAIVLACLLKRKPQHPHQNEGDGDRICSLWGYRWPLQARQQKSVKLNYAANGLQGGNMNDPRFSDGQSIESSLVKGE